MDQHDLNAEQFARMLTGQPEGADQEAPAPHAAPMAPESVVRRPEREYHHPTQSAAEQFAELMACKLGGPNFI